MLWVANLQTAGKAVSMCPSRILQRVATVLAPLSAAFRSCPQGRHFRLLCWLLVALLRCQGPATLKQLARALPRRLHYGSLLCLLCVLATGMLLTCWPSFGPRRADHATAVS
jgi:hypothetical protein